MVDKSNKDLLGLIFLCSLLKGASGQTYLHVFSSDGENVSLPCNNDLTDCTLTTWGYSEGSSETVTLFEKGIKNNDIKRRERLSLGSDCSLNIYKVTTEDRGFYTCRQFENTKKPTDANVLLNVLHVSPSSTQTEIRPGRSFTLSCKLYIDDDYPCDRFFISEIIELVWVNKAGVNLRSDSRYQISSSPHHCISTLTTTLLREDDNTEWTCRVITKVNELKTSVRYTVTYSENKTLGGWSVRVIITIAEIAALTAPTVILLRIICERRADNRRRGQDSQRTYVNVISEMNNTE